jgi:hypothetical protein
MTYVPSIRRDGIHLVIVELLSLWTEILEAVKNRTLITDLDVISNIYMRLRSLQVAAITSLEYTGARHA